MRGTCNKPLPRIPTISYVLRSVNPVDRSPACAGEVVRIDLKRAEVLPLCSFVDLGDFTGGSVSNGSLMKVVKCA